MSRYLVTFTDHALGQAEVVAANPTQLAVRIGDYVASTGVFPEYTRFAVSATPDAVGSVFTEELVQLTDYVAAVLTP